MLNTFAKLQLQLCNNIEYISYCEIFSYCCMCFISLWPRNWAFPWTWLSKIRSHNC